MSLVSNWQAVMTRAWSVRFIVLAAMLSGVEVTIQYLDGFLGIPQNLFAALSGLASAAALVARVVAQESIPAKVEVDPDWEAKQQTPIDLPDEIEQ